MAVPAAVPVVPPKPALVPLAAPPEWLERFGALSGSSFDAVTSCVEVPRGVQYPSFREAALITHRGLSGPSILQVSSYWQLGGARGPVALDLLPDVDAGAWLNEHRRDQQGLGALLAMHLPRRFALSFAELHGWTQPLAQLSNAVLGTIAQTLKGCPIQPSGTLGYAKAEVTLGGVDTAALSQQTLEAHAVPGLHFIGEVVDVTGWLGGCNFQWAWRARRHQQAVQHRGGGEAREDHAVGLRGVGSGQLGLLGKGARYRAGWSAAARPRTQRERLRGARDQRSLRMRRHTMSVAALAPTSSAGLR